MFYPDYQTIKFEHQERIDNAARARIKHGVARQVRTMRYTRYRTTIVRSATSIANRWRPSRKLTLPEVVSSYS